MEAASFAKTDSDWAAVIQTTLAGPPIAELLADDKSSARNEITAASIGTLSEAQAASFIDHTLLALDATSPEIEKLCDEALQYKFRTVCVRVDKVKQCAERFHGQQSSGLPAVAAVVGFHEGTYSTESKCAEVCTAIESGAAELDMVLNYELLKAGKYAEVYNDIKAVRITANETTSSSSSGPITLKVILETSQLTPELIVAGALISIRADADFVKTSTGFRGRGASLDDVKLMKAVCDVEEFRGTARTRGKAKVKASGGVRTIDDLLRMTDAGAERIGASAGVKIVEGLKARSNGSTNAHKQDGNTPNGTY